MEPVAVEPRWAFGILFVCVSIAVACGAILSEIAFTCGAQQFYYALIWPGSFAIVFGAAIPKLHAIGPAIRSRMKGSARWPVHAKVVNALCWAGPFVAISVFPGLYQYLILLGIGLGNLSTYLFVRNYTGNSHPEQLIVACISLASLPAAFALDTSFLETRQDIAITLSRIFIALSYAGGGAYGVLARSGS